MIEKPKETNHEASKDTIIRANKDIIHVANKESEAAQTFESKNSLEHVRAKVEEHSKSREDYKDQQEIHKHTTHEHHHYVTKEIKLGAFQQVMASTRTKLNKKETVASKLIHVKIIESVSEMSAKTIARPNQMLGGGILMVGIGSLLLFFAKRYGFELPLSTFIIIYLLGYFGLLIIEFLLRLVFKKKY